MGVLSAHHSRRGESSDPDGMKQGTILSPPASVICRRVARNYLLPIRTRSRHRWARTRRPWTPCSCTRGSSFRTAKAMQRLIAQTEMPSTHSRYRPFCAMTFLSSKQPLPSLSDLLIITWRWQFATCLIRRKYPILLILAIARFFLLPLLRRYDRLQRGVSL